MPGAEAEPLGAGGQPGQQVERVGQLAVLGQRHAAGVAVRVAALVADRHGDVLDGEQRLEPHLVGVLRERRHPRRVAGDIEPVRRQEPEGDHASVDSKARSRVDEPLRVRRRCG